MPRDMLRTKIARWRRDPLAGSRRAVRVRGCRVRQRRRVSCGLMVAGVASLLAVSASLLLLACEGSPLAPRAGLPEYRELATRLVPGPARLDVAGGNLLVSRTDLALDTQLGQFSVGAVWNSATRRWQWSFDDIAYANGSFSDATGAKHAIGSLAPGAAIPGTVWVKVSQFGQSGPNRVKTKGGLEYTFTTAGRPLAIRWASSPNPSLRFTQTLQGDGLLHTSAIEQCLVAPSGCRPVFTIHYDSSGRVREIADRAQRRARFSYDGSGALITARDGLDLAADLPGYRYEYRGGDLTAITNSEGERVEYSYDSAGRLLRVTQIGDGNPSRAFSYRGRNGTTPYRTIAIDPFGSVKVYRYDAEYQLLAVEDAALAETMTFTWGARRVTSRTAPDGSITQWTYADDDVATRIEPSGNVTIWLYQPEGVDRFWPGRRPLRRKADLLGTIEERDHDAAGRLRSIANGAGERLVLEYGIDQMVSGFEDPAGIVTSFSDYGEHGHPGSVSRAGIVQSFMYDAVGNLTEGPDPASASSPSLGGIVSRGFDADRNVTVVTLTDLALVPLATETVAINFRSDRKPILIARPGGGDVRFVYDELGQLVRQSQRADGVWSDTTFGYDAAGRRTAVDRPNGMGQRWTYDSAGRVTTHAIRNGSDTENHAAFAWERGRLRLFADGRSGTEVYSYDQAGRLDTVEYGNGDRAGLAWDLRSRQTGLSLDQRGGARLRTLALAYDEAGRERAVYEDGVPLIERTWSSGRLTRTEYGNGLVRQLGFDSELGTLSGATMTAGAGVIESTVVQVTDPECSIVASRCVSSQTTSTGAVSATSSERHHLVAADPDSLAGRRVGYEDAVGGGRPKIYHYDFLSNLRVGPSGGLRYNEEGNRLRDIDGGVLGAIHYDYDSAGFATRREGVPMTWDGAGRLASYGSATFEWDTLGRPVASTLSGTRTSRRFGGLVETDAVGDPVAIDLGEVRLDLAGNGARYRHFDYRGNVKLVTDATGTVVEHYEYSAYAVEAVYGVAVGTRGFARGRTVGDLVLIGHRLYDPAAARFLAPDPIHQLINQYAYTLGNPVEFWDPSGAQSVTNEQAAGAMMEAAGNSFSSVGAATFVAGLGLLAVPVPGVNVFTSVTLVGVGLNFLVLGEGLKAFGSLLQSEGAGSGGSGGGIGAGPGLSASPGFPEHAPPALPCGGDACAGGGAVGLGELATLANLGGPTAGVAAGGGSGCAPLALGEGRLSGEALALLLAANLVVAALLCGRSQRIRSARRGT